MQKNSPSKSNIKYRPYLWSMVLSILAGCAHSTHQTTHQTPHQNEATGIKMLTPTQEIRKYASEQQRRELEKVIDEVATEEVHFLKHADTELVKFWINYFAVRDKARFERFLANGAKYKKTIERILADHGLPKELFYVGLIESGYYLGAKSHAGAVGPWQFISGTAKRYGLTIVGGIDERRNMAKATAAAALYFQDLYNIFGNWELALSAYNAGEYGIVRRIREAKTRDYYELSELKALPKETRHYVPKVLAAMHIMNNPKKFNIKAPAPQDDIYANLIPTKITRKFDVNELASALRINKQQVLNLNPDLYWRNIPQVRGGLTLYLPNHDKNLITQFNRSTPRHIASTTTQKSEAYKIRRGDNLSTIAKRFNTTVAEIRRLNGIKNSHRIIAGRTLKVPGANSSAGQSVTYTVRRGDNLYDLARKHSTSISEIVQSNKLSKRTIYVGQRLQLPRVQKKYYTVRRGDYLIKIAKNHGISVEKLKELNSINNTIYPGQKLIVALN